MKRSKSQKYILDTLASHGEVHAMRGSDFGNRLLNAARQLEAEGLAKIVDYRHFEHGWKTSYRVVSA